jgi:hypothetical protein
LSPGIGFTRRRLITEAGPRPFERDTLYRPLAHTETTVTVAL